MNGLLRRALIVACVLSWKGFPATSAEPKPALANDFYAMDTSFRRPELTFEQQLDLVKELGFAGVAWTEQAPEDVQTTLDALRQRRLKMFTIYCAAKLTPEGDVTASPTLPALMKMLRGEGTILWLHFSGKGPTLDSLTSGSPLVAKLRGLAKTAEASQLKIAIYPHFGEWTARFADAVKLARLVDHPAFGVSFNLCHCLAAGDEKEIPVLLASAGPLLFTATLSGADSGVSGGKWRQLIQPLDQGTFDQMIVVRQLARQAFRGPIGFQGYGIKLPAREILTPTMAAWRKLGAAAGH